VQLHREVEAPGLHLRQEVGQCAHVARPFGQPRMARERHEVVDVRNALRQGARPRQPHQRDLCGREAVLERPQRRHGAQQIAEHQRPEDDDALWLSLDP
jgi:hypothetical protein